MSRTLSDRAAIVGIGATEFSKKSGRTPLRLALGAIDAAYDAIAKDGTNANVVDRMMTRARLNEVLHYEDYNTFDQSIFNFKL